METLENLNQVPKCAAKNFDELNFKEVNIGESKIARTFFKVNINEEYSQLGSREYPSSFLMKTESGNIYKVFKPNYGELYAMTGGNETACQQILSRPTERCIFNPKTRKIIGVESPIIKCGESFKYAPNCTTSPITEIVGFSTSENPEVKNLSFKSTIFEDFNQQQKKNL